MVTNRKPKERRGKVQLINAVELFAKMKKSLGNKRNYLTEENIAVVVRLYGEFKQGECSKIFKNDDFGYRRIVVERPLRLSFQVTPERLERLKEEAGFQGLARTKKKGKPGEDELAAGLELQEALLKALGTVGPDRVWKSRPAFVKALDGVLRAVGKVPAPVGKALLAALGERDETADICLDGGRNPEPDAELRDTENVPRTEDIHTYLEREVRPHVPDAWIDETKTREGYEIPFTRHFYQQEPVRPPEEIAAEIRKLEANIQVLLREALL